jgi:hypothetical protein
MLVFIGKNIIWGITNTLDPDNTNNQVILILNIFHINVDVWVINPV